MNAIRRSYKARRLEDAVQIRTSVSLADLFQIMESRRGFGVSDGRDMIFAHLGLTSDSTRSMLHVDYNKSIEQLYEEIAGKHTEVNRNASILYHVETLDLCKRRKGLPSWVPDWEEAGPTKASKVGLGNVNPIDRGLKLGDVEKYALHMYPRADCVGCLKPIPGVLGLMGWDLGPIISIMSASSLPILTSGVSQEDSVVQEISERDDNIAKYVSEWIWDTEESETEMPQIFKSTLKAYKKLTRSAWEKLQKLDYEELIRASIGSKRPFDVETTSDILLLDVVRGWFPLQEGYFSKLANVRPGNRAKRSLLYNEQRTMVSTVAANILDVLRRFAMCRVSGQQPVILKSGHLARVPSSARIGHHVFQVLGDDCLLLLERHRSTQASKDNLLTWLEVCGGDLMAYHKNHHMGKQTPVRHYKFLASDEPCEVYDRNLGVIVMRGSAGEMAHNHRKLGELGIVTLH